MSIRIPEPPLMEDQDQCEFYNSEFMEDPDCLSLFAIKYQKFVGITEGTVIDLGSGSCNFIVELCNIFPKLNFVCYEASKAMIDIAKRNISSSGHSDRIILVEDDFFNARGKYDAVLASRVLHHTLNPEPFWKLINSLSNNILICDLARPKDFDDIPESLPIDLKNSFKAAYSVDEVCKQIKNYPYDIMTEIYSDKFSSFNVFTKK